MPMTQNPAEVLTVDVDASDSSCVVLRLEGDLTLETAQDLRTRAVIIRAAHPEGDMVFDLGGVDHVDSTGLRLLRDVAADDERFAVERPSAVVRRLLKLTFLDATIPIR